MIAWCVYFDSVKILAMMFWSNIILEIRSKCNINLIFSTLLLTKQEIISKILIFHVHVNLFRWIWSRELFMKWNTGCVFIKSNKSLDSVGLNDFGTSRPNMFGQSDASNDPEFTDRIKGSVPHSFHWSIAIGQWEARFWTVKSWLSLLPMASKYLRSRTYSERRRIDSRSQFWEFYQNLGLIPLCSLPALP